MTLEELKQSGHILYECISGSRAYGLELPASDTDIKGVFYLPKNRFFGNDYIPQISNPTNDIVYYELGRFLELVEKNNPNILELLATPKDKILFKHPIFDKILEHNFLSKLCFHTFGGYAMQQVKKARGLNKKIVNPMPEEKKSILDFCYIIHNQGSKNLISWLHEKGWSQERIGLIKVPHFKDVYGLYYDHNNENLYRGIMKKEEATSVLISALPMGAAPSTQLYFNEDGYAKYCKDYKEYWKWVKERNQERYANNISHGKNYDSKNLMHTFRLLDMAFEILSLRKINVKRNNREELLEIRSGKWTYDELMVKAKLKMAAIENAHKNSTLPEKPDSDFIRSLLIELRVALYT